MLESIGVNVLSDFVFLLIIIALGWMVVALTRRTQLLKFFGINASRRIVVYLANLRVKQFGAIGIDGRQRSYQGSAMPFGEMLIANRFRDLFNYLIPSLSDRPGILSKILISDVQVQLSTSPLNHGKLEPSASFITFGSPAYNAASGFVETELHSQARFNKDYSEISVANVPPITEVTHGFVERIVDHDKKRSIFYGASLGELGTVGAAHFLATEWARLHRKYGHDTAFLVMLRFEPTDYRRWSIVFER